MFKKMITLVTCVCFVNGCASSSRQAKPDVDRELPLVSQVDGQIRENLEKLYVRIFQVASAGSLKIYETYVPENLERNQLAELSLKEFSQRPRSVFYVVSPHDTYYWRIKIEKVDEKSVLLRFALFDDNRFVATDSLPIPFSGDEQAAKRFSEDFGGFMKRQQPEFKRREIATQMKGPSLNTALFCSVLTLTILTLGSTRDVLTVTIKDFKREASYWKVPQSTASFVADLAFSVFALTEQH